MDNRDSSCFNKPYILDIKKYRYKIRKDVELVKRKCLRTGCGSEFLAPGRFVRICARCKANDIYRRKDNAAAFRKELQKESNEGIESY